MCCPCLGLFFVLYSDCPVRYAALLVRYAALLAFFVLYSDCPVRYAARAYRPFSFCTVIARYSMLHVPIGLFRFVQ